jgi:hypothetical protein
MIKINLDIQNNKTVKGGLGRCQMFCTTGKAELFVGL